MTLNLSDEYIAGLFDGEGWIGISINRNAPRSKHGVYYLYIGLSVREKYIIEFLRDKFGGNLLEIKPRKETYSTTYRWVVSDKRTYVFLDQISSLLIMKKKQADLAKKFIDFKKSRGFKALTEDQLSFYESCYNEMKQLNKRGVNKSGPN